MPTVRFPETEAESVRGLAGTQIVTNVRKNLDAQKLVSEYILTQVAAKVTDLGDKITNPAAVHVSFSWG